MIVAPERHSSDRIVAFSDGVVAIAITLLLLPLADLELPADGKISTLFADNAAKFGSMALSWAIIALFWLGHHRLFDTVEIVDGPLLRLNFLWLFAIALMPLPTNIIIENEATTQVVGFYIGWLALVSLIMMVMAWHVRRTPGIMDPAAVDTRASKEGWIRSVVVSAVFVLALLIALVAPSLAQLLLLLQLLVDPVARRLAQR